MTLVARKGKIAHLEAQGLMDMESKQPMPKDAIFRIMSMTKPVIGVAIMMMMEEGKVRLTDPVSKFIPEFKDMKVAVALAGPGRRRLLRRAGQAAAAPRFYTVPAEREITIRDLLTHTSGLVSGPMGNSRRRGRSRGRAKETLADYIPRLGADGARIPAGHALGLQRAGRLRHARAHRRDRRRDSRSISSCGSASSIRSG